jgi:hypothetical protein
MSAAAFGTAGRAVPTTWQELLLPAGTLPPRDDPGERAVTAWRRARSAVDGQVVGPLVWLDRDLDVLPRAVAGAGDDSVEAVPGLDRVQMHLVLWDTPPTYARSVAAVAGADAVDLVALHTRLPTGGNPRTSALRAVTAVTDLVPDDVDGFTEVPLGAGWPEALDVLADYGQAAALRLGEPIAAPLPAPAEIAQFLIACLDRDIGFATVGGPDRLLPVADRPGFGTLLLATRAALDGAGADDVAELLVREPVRADMTAVAGAAGSLREYLRAVSVCDLSAAMRDEARRGEFDRA